jgi:hypothetical protein
VGLLACAAFPAAAHSPLQVVDASQVDPVPETEDYPGEPYPGYGFIEECHRSDWMRDHTVYWKRKTVFLDAHTRQPVPQDLQKRLFELTRPVKILEFPTLSNRQYPVVEHRQEIRRYRFTFDVRIVEGVVDAS